MKLKWQIELSSENSSPEDFNCQPFIISDKIYFAYKEIDKEVINKNGTYSIKLHLLQVHQESGVMNSSLFQFHNNETYKRKVEASSLWQFQELKNGLSIDIGITLNTLSGQVLLESNLRPKRVKIQNSYEFGDFHLKYNQRSTLSYHDGSNVEKWKISMIGYLYTPIVRKDNFLHWGTAGKGGAFYFVDHPTGNIITEFNNGDASNYIFIGENVLLQSKDGNLIQLNPQSGQVISELELTGKLMLSKISLFDKRAWVVSHDLINKKAFLNLINIG
ncbi:MAG: hypothetical protein AAGA77_14450 [Bacteroidota bacterium]